MVAANNNNPIRFEQCPNCRNQVPVMLSKFTGREIRICETCYNKQENIKKEQEEIDNKLKVQENIAKIGVGKRFIGKIFDDYQEVNVQAKTNKDICINFVHTFNQQDIGLLLVGSVGTGKNMLSSIIAQELCKKNYSCLHTTTMRLIRHIKSTWGKSDISEQAAINSFIIPNLLIIDEVGIKVGSDYERLLFTEVINERYEAMKPTIMISNLKLNDLGIYLGERIMDRFKGGKVLIFKWESYRKYETNI